MPRSRSAEPGDPMRVVPCEPPLPAMSELPERDGRSADYESPIALRNIPVRERARQAARRSAIARRGHTDTSDRVAGPVPLSCASKPRPFLPANTPQPPIPSEAPGSRRPARPSAEVARTAVPALLARIQACPRARSGFLCEAVIDFGWRCVRDRTREFTEEALGPWPGSPKLPSAPAERTPRTIGRLLRDPHLQRSEPGPASGGPNRAVPRADRRAASDSLTEGAGTPCKWRPVRRSPIHAR
jgi:hypothetical protein